VDLTLSSRLTNQIVSCIGSNLKLTAFGGTFLTTLPIFAIITNSYTIKLTAFGGIFLATLPIFAIITNSYTIQLPITTHHLTTHHLYFQTNKPWKSSHFFLVLLWSPPQVRLSTGCLTAGTPYGGVPRTYGLHRPFVKLAIDPVRNCRFTSNGADLFNNTTTPLDNKVKWM